MNLATFDLNLLVIFDAMLRDRSVTKTGERLGLSQPAVSHALNRLRWLLKDQLFVRTPDGMMPTPRAEALAQPVREALNNLIRVLAPESFDPATAQRNFRLAVNNYAAVVLVGPVAATCATTAPNVRLSLRPSGTLDLSDMLDRGELDLALSNHAPAGDRFSSQVLIEDSYVVVMRRGHPLTGGSLGLDALAQVPHLNISSSGEDLDFVDRALTEQGLSRSIALEAPYLSAGKILVQSTMVAVLGRQIAEEFRRAYPIELCELPFPSPPLCSVMSWHRRFDDQPAHLWLRNRIASAATNL